MRSGMFAERFFTERLFCGTVCLRNVLLRNVCFAERFFFFAYRFLRNGLVAERFCVAERVLRSGYVRNVLFAKRVFCGAVCLRNVFFAERVFAERFLCGTDLTAWGISRVLKKASMKPCGFSTSHKKHSVASRSLRGF
jgi:hypothetical protein